MKLETFEDIQIPPMRPDLTFLSCLVHKQLWGVLIGFATPSLYEATILRPSSDKITTLFPTKNLALDISA